MTATVLAFPGTREPVWCHCPQPQPVTAYGWTYCGHCHRGLEPNKKEGLE